MLWCLPQYKDDSILINQYNLQIKEAKPRDHLIPHAGKNKIQYPFKYHNTTTQLLVLVGTELYEGLSTKIL